jgi:hypothetical protein
MRRTSIVAILALALALTASACAGPGPTEARRPTVHRDGDPPPSDSTTKKCGGMIGSGTYIC